MPWREKLLSRQSNLTLRNHSKYLTCKVFSPLEELVLEDIYNVPDECNKDFKTTINNFWERKLG